MGSQVKILVVDDTITYRNILRRSVAAIPGTEVVGVAPNGEIALDKIRLLEPDLVLLDIEMPQMDGLQALEEIKRRHPEVGVVMVSGTNRNAVDTTIKALELGALDFVRKPASRTAEENIAYIREHLTSVLQAFRTQYPPERRRLTSVETPVRRRSERPKKGLDEAGPFDLIAIGCSTGGPTALMHLVPQLDRNLPVPIAIVQHMPTGFTASLCRNLDAKSNVQVSEARPGEPLRPGCVYLAPGGRHLEVTGRKEGPITSYFTRISDRPSVNNCKPSVDVLFRSLAASFEGRVLALVLTGMGSDGVRGLEQLKATGRCFCITQTESSCVVYGMPRAVEQAGLSDLSLPLEAIGLRINSMIDSERRANVGC